MKVTDFFSDMPIVWRFVFLAGAVLIAVAWYFYCRWQQKKELKESLGDIPLDSKRVFKLDDYEEDRFDKHRFFSPVNPKLAVRVIECKDHDVIVYATSWPHLFISEQLIELQKAILEITKVSNDSHQLAVTKSPAANFYDFQERLIKIMFVQLHGKYALRFFPQKAKVTPASEIFHKQPHQSISDQTLAITFNQFLVDDDFRKLMNNTSSYSVSFFVDYPQTVFLNKRADYLWSRVEEEAIDFLTDYFSAGIDFEGEWSTIPKLKKPIEVELLFESKCQLTLTFLGIHLQDRMKDLMKAEFWGIDSVHVHHIFDPRKSIVTLILCPEIDFFQPLILSSILEKYDDKLNFNVKVIHPVKTVKNSKPALISYQVNAFGQLTFFLPFDFDSNLVRDELLLKVIEITDVNLAYEIHTAAETRFIVSKKDDVTWPELQFSILSVLVSITPRTLLTKGEWPDGKTSVNVNDEDRSYDTVGEGSINT